MARKKRDEIRESEIRGLKYFDQLTPLLERLHDDGCKPDKAGNRTLHFDQYCLLVLLYLFNPVCSSLLDVPAEIIALLYHYRWTIEIFFRTFKHLLGCRHLLSHNQNGIKIQTCCAMIA